MKTETKLFSLSASKMGDLDKCSQIFNAKSILKLPQMENDGSKRGTITHLVLETLSEPSQKDLVKSIIKAKTCLNTLSISNLIHEQIKKAKLGKVDNKGNNNLSLIDEMVLVGLNTDFYFKGAIKVEKPEHEISFTNEEKTYLVKGRLDRLVIYPNDEYVIIDYKTNAGVYEGDDLTLNKQALVYLLWLYKKTGKIGKVKFIFLRSPENPIQVHEFTKEQILGFETTLEKTSEYVQDFTPEKAMSNLAINQPYQKGFKGPIVCGMGKVKGELKKDGSLKWACSYRFPFDYFALIDEDGNVLKTAFEEKELETKSGQAIIKKHYTGCPYFNNKKESNDLI